MRRLLLALTVYLGLLDLGGCGLPDRTPIMTFPDQRLFPNQVFRCDEMQTAGTIEAAIDCYTEVLGYAEGDSKRLDQRGTAMIYNNRGLANAKIGRSDNALADLEKAARLDPNDPGIARNLTEIRARYR